jgi:hypothetical protein
MQRFRSTITSILCSTGLVVFALNAIAETPALPLPAEPKHGRPYLMPEAERQRIRGLIGREGWAKQEYEQLTKKAEGGDGYAAAFLFALERDSRYVPAATKWLLGHIGPKKVKRFKDRLDGSPLFTMSDGKTPLLFEQTKNGYTWPIEAPANIIGNAEEKCRWQAFFYGGRMSVRMIPEWTRFDRAHFEIPGRWESLGGPLCWKRVVGVDEKGKESDVRPGTKLKVTAAELEFPGGKWNLAFQFQQPQHIAFDGAGMKFSINSFTKENWQLGFVRPDDFDAWRGKQN